MRKFIFIPLLLFTLLVSAQSYYGTDFGGDGVGNIPIGYIYGSAADYRFRAEYTGTVIQIRVYLMYTIASGYGGGTGGTLKISLETDDGTLNHSPSGTVLASVTDNNPLGHGGKGCQCLYTLDGPANLVAGTLYHIHFTNIDADPVTNYVSINNLYVEPPASTYDRMPTGNVTDLAVLSKTGSNPWSVSTIYTPIYTIYYSDGKMQGQSYLNAASVSGKRTINGTNSKVQNKITISGTNDTVNSVMVRLKKISGSDNLTIRLEDGGGQLIEEGTIPSSVIGTTMTWVSFAFSSPHILLSGSTYQVVLSTGSATTYQTYAIQDGGFAYGYVTMFSDGHLEYTTNGSTWVSLGTDQKVQMYFELTGSNTPKYVSSFIGNASPSVLEMTYNLTLANVIPAVSAFTVSVNSVARTVNAVSISGPKVLLTLSTPIVYGDVVTVAYTKPAINPLQTASGGQAVSISSQSVINNVAPVAPIYISSSVENATPSRLEMTYNLTLANVIPAISAFTVNVNSVSRTVNAVSISGTKILLTLSTPVVYGDVITVAYTKPATNPLQTPSGGQAATITAQSVANNVAPVAPIYISSSVENATPSRLDMTYNLTLANVIPAVSAFAVSVNSVARTVNSVAISGTKVLLTLSTSIVYGDVVTVAYTKPASTPLQTVSGGQAVTISAQSVINNVAPVAPIYVSSSVENATPSRLDMTYNLTLANVIPEVSAFSVNVNFVSRTVNTVSISGTKVLLTLSSPVVYGDVVTVAYIKPATNPLQTPSGGQAVTISAQSVTNNVAPVAPLYISSSVENATPSRLDMTYNLTLANVIPAVSAFSVNVNSVSRTINTVSISSTKVLLTLSTPVVYGDVVTVAYTKPATNPLQTASGGQAITISAQSVINNVGNVTPIYVSSSIENAAPSTLEMNYNLALANVLPDASAFTVRVNTVSITANPVAISGTKVFLTLSNPVVFGDVVTVEYTKPSTNPLQTASGVEAATISAQKVTNNTINVAPITAITSPVNNSVFSTSSNITITANATDADGSITLVQFYSNGSLIGSKATAPYTFTWNNVSVGFYSLTVTATDNFNSKTTSSAISITVNEAPAVSISNPHKGNKFESPANIDIDVDASDLDGTISRVEIFSGSERLIELTASPYSFTWKDVGKGTYTLTAVATDNLNASTISAPVEFTVEDTPIYEGALDIINLYPNPNDGQFSMEFIKPLQNEKCEIIITDLAGKKVYLGTISNLETLKQFDLSDLKSGIYIIMIFDKNLIATKMIVK